MTTYNDKTVTELINENQKDLKKEVCNYCGVPLVQNKNKTKKWCSKSCSTKAEQLRKKGLFFRGIHTVTKKPIWLKPNPTLHISLNKDVTLTKSSLMKGFWDETKHLFRSVLKWFRKSNES